MTKAIALSRTAYAAAQQRQLDIARSAIVLACAASLIFAGQALPF
ncbi:hypothetical protein [uncultured Erythrobacter sp.]|nr:hypothetical protein [uncultured Erythrobacter sp.]